MSLVSFGGLNKRDARKKQRPKFTKDKIDFVILFSINAYDFVLGRVDKPLLVTHSLLTCHQPRGSQALSTVTGRKVACGRKVAQIRWAAFRPTNGRKVARLQYFFRWATFRPTNAFTTFVLCCAFLLKSFYPMKFQTILKQF